MAKTALVVGASGIVGSATAALLVEQGWTVHGLARRPTGQVGVEPVAADLQDRDATATALREVNPDAVFITTWARQDSEAENIRVNAAMVRNLLDGLPRPSGPRHVALVTGLKHYLGPFEAYGKGTLPQTPFREEQGRLDVENFYYAQEDEVFAAATRDGFTWSVHRPHTVIGLAVGNAMNMGTTLAVYATLCRETGRPFTFPGSAAQWSGLTDMTDAGQLARHLLWATETEGRMTRRSTSSTATSSAGNGCGAVSPTGSGSRRCRSTASFGPWSNKWRAMRRCGARLPCVKGSPKPIWAALPPLAHRCRSRPPHRSGDRYVQEQAPGLHRLSADRRRVLFVVRAAACRPPDPLGVCGGAAWGRAIAESRRVGGVATRVAAPTSPKAVAPSPR